MRMPRCLSSEVDKVVRPGRGLRRRFALRRNLCNFFKDPLQATGTSRLENVFLGSKLYTRVRSVALEIAFVRQGHSRSLDRSQLFDRSSAVTLCRNIRDVSLKNKNFLREIPVFCIENTSEKVET